MWRISLTLFVVLSSIIGALLIWQWSTYSEDNELISGQIELVEQEITVTSSYDNKLTITQVFTGLLPEKEYVLWIPERAEDWSCIMEEGHICESPNENSSSFFAEKSSVKFIYDIPLEEGSSPFLLVEWLNVLPDIEVINTRVEVVDSIRKTGSWVVGLPMKGIKELDLIDYYVFEGRVPHPSVYFQPKPLEHSKGNHSLEFYFGIDGSSPSFALETLERIPDFPGATIVFTNELSETNGNGLMVLKPGISEELLERKMIYNYFFGRTEGLPIEQQWLLEMLTSLLTNQESYVGKGNEAIFELKENLTEEELEKFLHFVMEIEEITPEKLDEQLERITGKRTKFFAKNKNEDTALIPLYFYEQKRIYIEGKPQEEFPVFIIEGERLFPFEDTMRELGYMVKALADEETILLSKGNNSYRFYVNQNIFIYNEEDFGLLENPLRFLDGKLYMEESWLQTLFKVRITVGETEIKLINGY